MDRHVEGACISVQNEINDEGGPDETDQTRPDERAVLHTIIEYCE